MMLDMGRTTHHPSQPIFPQEFAEYLVDVPRRGPRFDWFVFAVIAGAVLALVIFTVANLVF